MKKGVGVLFLSLILVLSVFLVIAQSSSPASDIKSGVEDIIDTIVEIISPILSPLIGEDNPSSEDFFAKALFFIIVLSVIWIALDRTGFFAAYPFTVWLISFVISILAVRYIGSEVVSAILLPYSALGVAITAALPFVIWFILVEFVTNKSPTFRKIAWIFFAVIFIGIWVTRPDEVGPVAWIYPTIVLISLIMLFLDGTIQRFLRKIRYEKRGFESQQKYEEQLLTRLENLENLHTRNRISDADYHARKRTIERQLNQLYR